MPGTGEEKPTQTRGSEDVQAEIARRVAGRITWKDVDKVRSNFGDLEDPKTLFDGDRETGTPLGTSAGTMKIYFKKATFIEDVNILTTDPTAFTGAGTFQYHGDDGADYSPTANPTQAEADRVYVPPPSGMTVPVIAISMTPNVVGGTYAVSQVVAPTKQMVEATVNVGGVTVTTSLADPLQVSTDQQINNDDADVTLAAGWTAGAGSNVLDKDGASTISGATPGDCDIDFEMPILISRVAVWGSVIGCSVVVVGVDGSLHTVRAVSTDADGVDSGNFTPILAVQVVVSCTGASTVKEVTILKTVEVKNGMGVDEIRSDKDTHFTTAVADGAMEAEELGATKAPSVVVRRVVAISEENLDFDVAFFDTSGEQDTDYDVDSFMGMVEFVASDARQITSGSFSQYYYDSGELAIPYHRAANDGLMTVGYVSRSVAGKAASASGGEVVFRIFYTLPGGR